MALYIPGSDKLIPKYTRMDTQQVVYDKADRLASFSQKQAKLSTVKNTCNTFRHVEALFCRGWKLE